MGKIIAVFMVSAFLSVGKTTVKPAQDSLGRVLEPSLENLFYGNINEVITKLLWVGDRQAIGLRWGQVPKDLVLFNKNKLIVDSLSINGLFLDGYEEGSGSFISIQGLLRMEDQSFVVLHNYGSTKIGIVGDRFEVLEKRIPQNKPAIPERYLDGYRMVHLGRYTLGHRSEQKKYVTSADFWVYDWDTGKHVVYEDSKHPEESKNWYWKLKNTPESYSTYYIHRYNIIQTRDGFIFNLPLKNRFLSYSEKTGSIQGYTFPPLEKKNNAWFAFYDWELDRVYPVLDTDREYRIYVLDAGLKNFHYLASSPEQPIGVTGGRVYMRELEFKEKSKQWFCNHYLVDLYPKVK